MHKSEVIKTLQGSANILLNKTKPDSETRKEVEDHVRSYVVAMNDPNTSYHSAVTMADRGINEVRKILRINKEVGICRLNKALITR